MKIFVLYQLCEDLDGFDTFRLDAYVPETLKIVLRALTGEHLWENSVK